MVSSKLILDFLVISSNRIKVRNKAEKKHSLNTHTHIYKAQTRYYKPFGIIWVTASIFYITTKCFCQVTTEDGFLQFLWNIELLGLDYSWQSRKKTGHWFITTCDAIEWTWSYFRIFLHEGARVCSKIKQLCFMIVCTQAEWLGLQRDLCACIMPWALPVLNPCGISQLQPSVLGDRWAWKKRTMLLSFITTALFLPQFWKAKELWALADLPSISFDTASLYFYFYLLKAENDGSGCCYDTRLMICLPVWHEVNWLDWHSCLYFGGPRVTIFVGTREQVWTLVRKWIVFFCFP